MTLSEMKDDYDWQEAWAYASGKSKSGRYDSPTRVEGYKGSSAAATIDDVAEIIATDNGENDGQDWVGVFKLKDGRYLFLTAGCDYTGWDCQADGSSWVAGSLDQLIQFGLTDDARSRLGLR